MVKYRQYCKTALLVKYIQYRLSLFQRRTHICGSLVVDVGSRGGKRCGGETVAAVVA